MQFLPVVDNIQMEGNVSQIFDIGPSCYFMIKIRETFYNSFFLTFILYFAHENWDLNQNSKTLFLGYKG